MHLSVSLDKKNFVRKTSLKNGRDTGNFLPGHYLLQTFIFTLCVIQNMDKTPVKNQYGKFLHINTVHRAVFLWTLCKGLKLSTLAAVLGWFMLINGKLNKKKHFFHVHHNSAFLFLSPSFLSIDGSKFKHSFLCSHNDRSVFFCRAMSITSEIKFQSLSSRVPLTGPFSSGMGRAATVRTVGHNGSSQLLR